MGITYNYENGDFLFNFENDGREDLIRLLPKGYRVEAFEKCFYYAYEFVENVDSGLRSAFIQYLKYSPSVSQNPGLSRFIQKAINDLSRKINLYNYDLVVMPQSQSRVNEYMLRYIYRFAQPMLREIELVKSLPERIAFDMDGYERQYLNAKLENGYPRYTPQQKEQVKTSIREMLNAIHQKDYFSIAKDVKKSKMRPYIVDFLRFKDEKDERLCQAIQNQNVLVVDDIATSGSTLNEILRSLRILNENNTIVLFSLIGRKDLMVESI